MRHGERNHPRAALDGYREEGLMRRLLKIEMAGSAAAIVALVIALKVVMSTPSRARWLALLPALVIGVGFYMYRRRRLARAQRRVEASEQVPCLLCTFACECRAHSC